MKNYQKRYIGIVIIVISVATLLLAVSIGVNYINLNEAFGSGPPYYDRTTNMDKWSNPIPKLLLIDIFVLLIIGGLVKVGLHYFRLIKQTFNVPDK